MLLAILYIYQNTGSTDFLLLSLTDISLNYQKILWLSFFFSKRNMTCRLINSSNSTLNYGPSASVRNQRFGWRTQRLHTLREKEGPTSQMSGRTPATSMFAYARRGSCCKSLVVYLSPDSLGSTLKYKNFSSGLREMCNIPVHLDSILLGVLLSDG